MARSDAMGPSPWNAAPEDRPWEVPEDADDYDEDDERCPWCGEDCCVCGEVNRGDEVL